MDRLEEFIRQNREDLDRYSPSPDIWDRISGTRRITDTRKRIIWLTSAAMIIIILGSAVFFYFGENRRSIVNNREALIMKANPALREAEIYYTSMYNNLITEATPLLSSNPDFEAELINDLSQIDSICNSIKNDLKDNVSNQEVIEALINNYRIKLRILEEMLEVLKEDENTNEKGKTNAL